MNKKKVRLYYVLLLILGFGGQILPKLFPISWGAGFFTLIWIYAFLELVCRFRTKKELFLTGVVFIIAYILKFAGTMGNSWMNVGLFGIFGLVLYAVLCISAYFMHRWDKFAGTLFFPAFWILVYLIATILRVPVLVRVDMMFTDMNVLMHAERLIGSFGFSFAILWIISLLRFATSHRKIQYAGLSFGLFLVILLPGIIYLYPNTMVSESVRVAYTTGPYGGDFIDYVSLSYETNEESLKSSIQNAASQQAEILVFNEEAFELDDTDEGRFIQQCASLARENSIAVLIGLDVRDTDGSEGGKSINKLVLIGEDGDILHSYQKSRLIPILESDYVQGDGNIQSDRLQLNGKNVKIAYLICYDSNFPEYVKRVEPDTDILFLPSWDWSAITELHAKLCRTIAVENNIYILKPTYDGISVAIDPDGQIFHMSSTDETGYEQIQIVDMPIKSTTVPVEGHREQSAFVHAIIGTDSFSMLICFILLAGTVALNTEKTRRAYVFSMMLFTNTIACGADALSWILDGHSRLNSVVYCSTVLSMLLTFVLMWQFVAYFFEYIKERVPVSSVPVIIFSCISCVAVILTVIMCINGSLFTVKDAVYSDGPKYNVYVIISVVMMLYSVVAITTFRKSFSFIDRVVAYVYIIIPIASGIINLFFADWSFVYPATTLSMVLVYVMIQSDKVDQLEHEGKIVSYHVTHDELTGLYNRRAFQDRRASLIETDGTSGIIFGDLNGLKYANDNLGHAAGDELLIRFATILANVFRSNEIFRISGDEFICMMENVNEDVFCRRLNELERMVNQDEQPLACLGAAFGPNRDIDTLIKNAESKMYIEKNAFHERFPETVR